MANDVQIVIRLPADLDALLVKHAAELSKRSGVPVTKAAAVRKLLVDALAAAGKKGK